jgi:anti-anti-sigma factor
MPLRIKVEKKRDYVYTVGLEGSLDTDTSAELEQELREVIDEKTRAVILDMQGLTYISSVGIRVVIWAKKTLEAKEATFIMTNLQPQIKKVFDVMKILPMLDIFDDIPEADKYIGQLIKDELEKQSA